MRGIPLFVRGERTLSLFRVLRLPLGRSESHTSRRSAALNLPLVPGLVARMRPDSYHELPDDALFMRRIRKW